MALRLNDSWRRRRARLKLESACIQSLKNWYSKKFKAIFNTRSLVSMGSNGIGVKERHQLKNLLTALCRIFNWLVRHINLLLFLLTHSTSVLFFVLVIYTGVCDSGSSSMTTSETFAMAHFVVKPTLRSNRLSKFKPS